MVPWIALQCVILLFPDHTHCFFNCMVTVKRHGIKFYQLGGHFEEKRFSQKV